MEKLTFYFFIVAVILAYALTLIINSQQFGEEDRLLMKGGTGKKYCSDAPYLATDYVDNYYNPVGNVIDECKIPPGSGMDFIFKQHDQSTRNHTGTIIIKMRSVNLESNNVIQVLISENSDTQPNYPKEWIFCGNIKNIGKGAETNTILCEGKNLKFIRILNAEWSKSDLYLDGVEVYRYSDYFVAPLPVED